MKTGQGGKSRLQVALMEESQGVLRSVDLGIGCGVCWNIESILGGRMFFTVLCSIVKICVYLYVTCRE